MSKPFFTVMVAAHNAEPFIRKGLESIREQSFQDYELIVVCDNCKDKTEDIVMEYIRPDHDTILVGAYGSGSASYNAAIDIAQGEWVLFMDHDDWFLHEFVFQMIAEAVDELKDIDLLSFGFLWKGFGYRVSTPGHIYPALWTKCWRREFIGDERIPIWSAIGDYGFARKMYPKARIAFCNMPFYYYNYLCEGSASAEMKDGFQSDFSDLPPDAQEAARQYIEAMKNDAF